MKNIGTMLGTCILGRLVIGISESLVGTYAIIGGWFTAFIVMGTMWCLNHYIGLINQEGILVDMGLGIGLAGTMEGIFVDGI